MQRHNSSITTKNKGAKIPNRQKQEGKRYKNALQL